MICDVAFGSSPGPGPGRGGKVRGIVSARRQMEVAVTIDRWVVVPYGERKMGGDVSTCECSSESTQCRERGIGTRLLSRPTDERVGLS
jgi:hypothetical protein